MNRFPPDPMKPPPPPKGHIDLARMRAERDKAIKLLCDVLGSDYGPDIDAYLDGHVQPPCVEVLIRERDEARAKLAEKSLFMEELAQESRTALAKLAELRAAVLAVGYISATMKPETVAFWNSLVTELRADAAAKEGK